METCMLLCFHVHITWKSVNVYMKACSHVLLQLVLTFDASLIPRPFGGGERGYLTPTGIGSIMGY